jgi:hypothetical protein
MIEVPEIAGYEYVFTGAEAGEAYHFEGDGGETLVYPGRYPFADFIVTTEGEVLAAIYADTQLIGADKELKDNQEVFTKPFTGEELAKFNLFDIFGTPTTEGDVFKREREE